MSEDFKMKLDIVSPSPNKKGEIYSDGKSRIRISKSGAFKLGLEKDVEIVLGAHIGSTVYLAKKTNSDLFGFEAKKGGNYNDRWIITSRVLIKNTGLPKGSYTLVEPVKQEGETWLKLEKA